MRPDRRGAYRRTWNSRGRSGLGPTEAAAGHSREPSPRALRNSSGAQSSRWSGWASNTRCRATSTSADSAAAGSPAVVGGCSGPGSPGPSCPHARQAVSPSRRTRAVDPQQRSGRARPARRASAGSLGRSGPAGPRPPRASTGWARAPDRTAGARSAGSRPEGRLGPPSRGQAAPARSASAFLYACGSRTSGIALTTFQRTTPALSMMNVARRAAPRSSLKTPYA